MPPPYGDLRDDLLLFCPHHRKSPIDSWITYEQWWFPTFYVRSPEGKLEAIPPSLNNPISSYIHYSFVNMNVASQTPMVDHHFFLQYSLNTWSVKWLLWRKKHLFSEALWTPMLTFFPNMLAKVGSEHHISPETTSYIDWLNGGLEHFILSHILGIVIPIDEL